MRRVVLGFMLATLSAMAAASSFEFTYRLLNSNGDPGPILSGALDGDLQVDHDTVNVNAITSLLFNNAPTPAIAGGLGSAVLAIQSGILGGTPVVSLSGNAMDLVTCVDAAECADGFLFVDGRIPAGPAYTGAASFGNTQDPFERSRWSLVAASAVPIPNPALLLLPALAGVAMHRRRRDS